MPVYRLTASSIISSFRVSGKRHLLLLCIQQRFHCLPEFITASPSPAL